MADKSTDGRSLEQIAEETYQEIRREVIGLAPITVKELILSALQEARGLNQPSRLSLDDIAHGFKDDK